MGPDRREPRAPRRLTASLRPATLETRMNRLAIDQQIDLMDRGAHAPFSKVWLLGEDGRRTRDNRLTDAYDDALCAMIEGYDDAQRDKVMACAGNASHPLIDRITAELAAEACCDPLTALALAVELGTSAVIEDASTDELVLMVDPWNPSTSDATLTAVWVAPDILWYACGRLVAPLPEIALVAAVGRRLRDVISHPVLDRHAITITGVTEDGMGRAVFQTDAERTPIGIKQLATIRPPGATTKRITT